MKTTSVHCVAAAKLSIESPLVEKPAVGIVVRACASDWYGDIRSSMPVAPYDEEDQEQRGREGDVEHPDALGGVPDPGAERLDLRPRHLVLEQLAAADAQPRQHGESEDDDPDPAEPLGELAPHGQAARQLLDVP